MPNDSLRERSLSDSLVQKTLAQEAIGNGGFGQLYSITGYSDPPVVLKYFDDTKFNPQQYHNARLAQLAIQQRNQQRKDEVEFLKALKHRGVVQYVGCVKDGENIVGIFMRLVENKTLAECKFLII
ncbi:unnamed protein product, partial [Mesorhabditis belari]|uniref:Protein kinase domain-containing protein n=1 Tax=Mesorhabditis belari TaxID=2138241 RepID=A0AAF3EXG2_9BILA